MEDPGHRTPEEMDRHWFEHVYQGDRMRQLTLRAILMGMVLGMFLACSNLYIGLRAGWSLGVAVTACVLAYSFFRLMHRLFPKWFPEFTILENNCMQSVAVGAGSISGAGLVNAIPALMMLNPDILPHDFAHRVLYITPWIVIITFLGVFLAVPTKRQLINIEKLPFPDGMAAAATMRSLHDKGGTAVKQAKALGLAAGLGALITWFRDADAPWLKWYPKIPSTWGTSWIHIGRWKLSQLTMSFEGSLLFVASGAIMSLRQGWSLALGAVVNYVVLAPIMLDRGVITDASFRGIARWGLWIGVPMMVTSGLLLFFMNWKSVARAFSGLGDMLRGSGRMGPDVTESVEVPGSWFAGGFVVLGLCAIVAGNLLFHITWWMGTIAVLATFFLVVVAGRATGETNTTPVGPLSKITQLTFGAIKPGDVTVNLMTANITAGATGERRRPAAGSQGRLHPRRQPAPAVLRPAVRRAGRRPDLRAGLLSPHPRREPPRDRAVAGAGGAGLARGRRAPRQGAGGAAPDRARRPGRRRQPRHHPAAPRAPVPEVHEVHPVADRHGARVHHQRLPVDVDVHRRGGRVVVRAPQAGARRDLHHPGRVRHHRRREPARRGHRAAHGCEYPAVTRRARSTARATSSKPSPSGARVTRAGLVASSSHTSRTLATPTERGKPRNIGSSFSASPT
jgi:hypothetical protein